MAVDSQVANLGSIASNNYTGVLHEVYAGKVKPAIRAQSVTMQLFQDAGPGEYRIDGEKLVGSTDLLYSGRLLPRPHRARCGRVADHADPRVPARRDRQLHRSAWGQRSRLVR